mmetsp:Transcript_35662/g.57712  ORF Transcript_35662/g.57712 Transcript_35662/m.57712 type:complete len:326 (+) Transcript_35662:199-1176(+)|eukprot:CAMPEP_0184645004 /NCGR_PEP_ID=MMETSP0308-20130426/1580_1 /TAXON_ID=38269 /ORGANISM="Gloeochaete witrockiana, Strain SAG 46.84" /LENGTH=325 /DNA_ID=CAMNT_0027073785 /DNA_START=165 /DNA_END=1142 /DNA_ORIENTATION=+
MVGAVGFVPTVPSVNAVSRLIFADASSRNCCLSSARPATENFVQSSFLHSSASRGPFPGIQFSFSRTHLENRRFAIQPVVAAVPSVERAEPKTLDNYGKLKVDLVPVSFFDNYEPFESLYESMLLSVASPLASVTSIKNDDGDRREFIVNAGECVRVLRDELPEFFDKGLTYDIYDENIQFHDGDANHVNGLGMYKTLMWSIRFHLKMIFSDLRMDVRRICQPSPERIHVRWQIRGVPRLATSNDVFHFDGCSVYLLNSKGRIMDHKLENINHINTHVYLEPLQRLWVLPETHLAGAGHMCEAKVPIVQHMPQPNVSASHFLDRS